MAISVRRLVEHQWQVLRDVRLRALKADPSVFSSNYEKESAMTDADWKSWLRTNDTAVFVLYEDPTPIGMAAISVDREDPTKKRAILWGSWLEPFARGKGLSKTMYEARLAWAKEHPTIETVIVSHRASNLSSKQANQKHGFVFTHSVEKVWPDGTRDDNVFYALAVKSSRPTVS
jgi:RimJ/RimL family protein N-acetyltransferase